MTDTSLILGLPYIQPSQAQKHVTHNEALRVLDALVQLSVEATDQTTPPSNAQAGHRHIVAAPGQGVWVGHSNEIAVYDGITWTFFAPQEGWQAYVRANGGQVVFNGTDWQPQGSDMVDTLGINATADNTNRLSVSSDAVLLNHAGSDHQVKVNKASATDTASFLFQTGFSGRAEMGTAGSDTFQFKVSPDGSSWLTAMSLNPTTADTTVKGLRITNDGTSDLSIMLDGSNTASSLSWTIEQNAASGRMTLVSSNGNKPFKFDHQAQNNLFRVGAVRSDVVDLGGVLKLGSYNVASLPTASGVAGGMIYVSDEAGGAVMAFSDGTNWRRVTDRAVVS